AVAAVAFFAMWSVLSNLLCAVLIYTIGPFRIGDVVEFVDKLDHIANSKRPDGVDQHGAKQVGQHAPHGEERHRSDR
ncbi:hypothetical protein QCD79_31475, partial [Pseudomonas quasicaspiana]|nr:hypothetical protein [Pseudomonas quasicaspiana]